MTPIITKRIVGLKEIAGKGVAVDANGELHQFIALIRLPDGSPLADRRGNPISHLAGPAFRTTRLIHDYGIKPTFVFDGKPPGLKEERLVERR